jgi:hypothetical protein
MIQRKVDIRRRSPLSERSGATTALDRQEQFAPTGRGREFRDALTRAVGAAPGVPMLAKEWGWYAR